MSNRALLLLAFCVAMPGMAQTAGPFSRTQGADHLPRSGKYTITMHQELERSLSQLAESAELIVDGIVLANLPAFNYNPKISISIETDSTIAVNSTIKGAIEGGEAVFLLGQHGGRVGELEVEAVNSPIVKSGERYIFFLNRDEREIPDTGSKLPRYYVIGVWSGLVRVETGKVRFAETAESSLRQSENSSVDDFKALILDTLHHRVPIPVDKRPAMMWPFKLGDPRGVLPPTAN